MASSWRFALFLSVLLMVDGVATLRGNHRDAVVNRTDSGHTTTGDTGHDDGGQEDSSHGDSGHGDGGEPITTLPIVTWKWHHVSTPYLVTLWILVSWICKLKLSPVLWSR
ncbi:hypothetical protein INR49_010732 [Caranx melampygus]|nr:hypothetical protein INR49_009262 [Caranx melampygus]KAG7231682.1 hypothetical protein INR49_010732 [Caranx melampygus]